MAQLGSKGRVYVHRPDLLHRSSDAPGLYSCLEDPQRSSSLSNSEEGPAVSGSPLAAGCVQPRDGLQQVRLQPHLHGHRQPRVHRGRHRAQGRERRPQLQHGEGREDLGSAQVGGGQLGGLNDP